MKKVTSAILLSFLFPLLTFAQVAYQPLISIPGINDKAGGGTFSDYIGFLYGLSIAIAALLAVIKIIVAGVKYMLSASVGAKGNAKSEIQGALLGLLLILGAYIILNTLNPNLTKGNVKFEALPPEPGRVTRPGVQVTNSQTQTAAAAAAEARLAAPAPANTCIIKTTTSSANNNSYGIDVRTCPAGYDPAPYLGAFSLDCSKAGGTRASLNGGKTMGCAVPKTSTNGTQTNTTNTTTGTQTTSTNCTPGISNSTSQFGNRVITYNFTACSGTGLSNGLRDQRAACTASGGNFTCTSNICNCTLPK